MERIDDITIAFKPSEIKVENKENFEAYVNAVVSKYKGYCVTPETMRDDKAVRASINKLNKAIDDKRKEIKKDFNAPLKDFEEYLKRATEPLAKTITLIDSQIKDIEQQGEEERSGAVREAVKEIANASNLDYRIFEEHIKSWSKKGNFTASGKISKTTKDSIEYVITQERLKQEEFNQVKSVISKKAYELNVSETPYIKLLENGNMSAFEVANLMENDCRQREVEQQKKAEQAEQQKEAEQVEQKVQETSFQKPKEASVTYVANIDIEFSTLEEKDRWKKVMTENGFKFTPLKFTEK